MLFDTVDKLYSHLRQFRIPKGVQGSGESNGFWEITVSGPLRRAVERTGGDVFVYNPATDTLTKF